MRTTPPRLHTHSYIDSCLYVSCEGKASKSIAITTEKNATQKKKKDIKRNNKAKRNPKNK